jgi:PPK2 family polyphosphate:nucleotide phosphotransferase
VSAATTARGLDSWRVSSDGPFALSKVDPSSTPNAPDERAATDALTVDLRTKLRALQDRFIAEGTRSVLVVLQAMDGGGKDGTVKGLYAGMHPVGAEVTSWGVPSEDELAHDFLWRIHHRLPSRGKIGLFNRSHYEDVLAVRVRNIAPPAIWQKRYSIINNWEEGLVAEGTTVVKIMLHISRQEQANRLQARIDRPDKRWKFRMGDLEDRKLWPLYQDAYDDMIDKTSTGHAPWFVVPADKKWYRDFAVATILTSVLEEMKPEYPPCPELDGVEIPGAVRKPEPVDKPKKAKVDKKTKNVETSDVALERTDSNGPAD